jgi:hypothetical protein
MCLCRSASRAEFLPCICAEIAHDKDILRARGGVRRFVPVASHVVWPLSRCLRILRGIAFGCVAIFLDP